MQNQIIQQLFFRVTITIFTDNYQRDKKMTYFCLLFRSLCSLIFVFSLVGG